eukprot:3828847-Pyramimonas_sp.AAC.1
MLAVSIASAAANIKPKELKAKKPKVAKDEVEGEDPLCVVGGPVLDIACQLEKESTNELTVLGRLCVADSMVEQCTIVESSLTVAEVAEALAANRHPAAAVTNSVSDQQSQAVVVGTVALSSLQRRMATSKAAAQETLAKAMAANSLMVCAKTVRPSDSLLTASFMLDQEDTDFIAAVNQEGGLAGIISRDAISLAYQVEEVEITLRNIRLAEIKSPQVTKEAKLIMDTASVKAE